MPAGKLHCAHKAGKLPSISYISWWSSYRQRTVAARATNAGTFLGWLRDVWFAGLPSQCSAIQALFVIQQSKSTSRPVKEVDLEHEYRCLATYIHGFLSMVLPDHT